MVEFEKFTLPNGLQVFVHEDHSAPLAVMNILYDVGSRDEEEEKTGFAHLFEHLMFGGSVNIPNYDSPLQKVGGENNAFTSPDITNYYLTLPAQNLETGFWLESDRMLSLSFDPKVLEVQRNVVIEEFKQRYLNQPYGDAWLKLRPMAYKVHPYKWPTIGKSIQHIEDATMEDVKDFFQRYYHPGNAILVVAGDVTLEQVKKLSEKWFAPIPAGPVHQRNLPEEPVQKGRRETTVEAEVPASMLYKTFLMPPRTSQEYYVADLLSDVLGRGESSRLHQKLVEEEEVFSMLNAYVTGSVDAGLLVVHGQVSEPHTVEEAEQKVRAVIEELITEGPTEEELDKVKNQAISTLVFGDYELLNRAMNIAFGAVMGNPNLINEEADYIRKVTRDEVHAMAKTLLSDEHSSNLFYKSKA